MINIYVESLFERKVKISPPYMLIYNIYPILINNYTRCGIGGVQLEGIPGKH